MALGSGSDRGLRGGSSASEHSLLPLIRTSEILASLKTTEGPGLTVGQIVAVLSDRAFALLVVLLGLPNCLPMPPPIPLLCGLLLALVAVQIALGRPVPWLPVRLLDRRVPPRDLARAVDRAVPILRKLERWSRPRLTALDSAFAFRLIGLLLLALALGLLVAAPIVGQIPLGVAVSLVGLGLVERDGLVVLGGLGVGSIGLAINFGFIVAVIAGIDSLM